MGSITLLKNQNGLITPTIDAIDSGWSISGIYATHTACNAGYMKTLTDFGFIIGHTYSVTFIVDRYVSGGVKAIMGTANGTTRSANGKFTENIICTGNTVLQFYSDGALRISGVFIYDIVQPSQPFTFSFNERTNMWSGNQSFVPEKMLRFVDEFYSFKNGQLYQHNRDDVPRNTFYGVKYPSRITFFVNSEWEKVKLLQGMIIRSNKVWFCPNDTDILILPYEGKSLGMNSRLKKKKFVVLQGQYYADFLRNMADPRFDTTLKALMYGEELRGNVAQITIENDDDEMVVLTSVDVIYTPQMLT